jgi:two-component system cell cycle sensor histidine kinase/response regulator CckA
MREQDVDEVEGILAHPLPADLVTRIVAQSPMLIVITDADGCVEYVNPRFEAVTGYPLATIRGQHTRVLGSGETPAATYAELWRTIRAGGTWRGELHNRTRTGEAYHVLASIAPLHDDRGDATRFIAIQEDITELKRLEAQFWQAQRLECLGLLASGIAHDFNNLMSVIVACAEMALEDIPEGSAGQRDVAEIRRTADRAIALTQRLLAFSRPGTGFVGDVDLGALALDVAGLVRRLVNGGIDVVVVPSSRAARVRANPGQLEQVVLNLCVNARDAMPDGGRLVIRVDVDGTDALLRVIDTGTGMTPDVLAHAFEPFFTTKDRAHGTGLGLSTCAAIVQRAGGRIEVDTAPGRGTTMTVRLPRIPSGGAS